MPYFESHFDLQGRLGGGVTVQNEGGVWRARVERRLWVEQNEEKK